MPELRPKLKLRMKDITWRVILEFQVGMRIISCLTLFVAGNVASVYLICTATGAVQVGTRIGSKVGAAAAAYDANKKNILFGGSSQCP